MFVRMTETTKVAIDGYRLELFREDETYEVDEDLGEVLVRGEQAVEVESAASEETPEEETPAPRIRRSLRRKQAAEREDKDASERENK